MGTILHTATPATDQGYELVGGVEAPAGDLINFTIPDAVGPWLDSTGKEFDQDTFQVAKVATAFTPPADLATLTPAQFANLTIGVGSVSTEPEPVVTGPAIERTVFQRNRGSTMSFGDLQFRVPSSGNSSLQMRMGSGSMVITNFLTHWSHQQGGASEEGINFTLNTSWRYFRQQGLTLTQHNNTQEAIFQANGWLYHVQVIVGGSWQNNRFSFTRWRLDGVQGDPGSPGIDGTDGRGIVTAHRSDGVTAIGGTTYTLDHIIYEYTDGVFEDKGLLLAPPTNIDYFQGNNVEYLIPGEFWDGKQVYGRSFERQLNSGNIALIANGIVDELLDFNGQLHHSWFGMNIAGDCTDSRYSWKIGFNSPTDKTVRYRSFGSSDAHVSTTVHKFALKYTKQ